VEECGRRCLRCGSRTSLTVDHVIPLGRGGSNAIDNIQPLCSTCNGIKGCETRDYRTDRGILSRGVPAPLRLWGANTFALSLYQHLG
jgi:5-methylcytosine-specific restriction endonuclease McrA